jgi:sugar (pentulose or hexulose) kinase
MIKPKVILVFDIGKTNKKALVFDEHLKLIYQEESKFELTKDDDGFECDDIELIELWIKSTLTKMAGSDEYELVGVNFTTYGASLAFLDEDGNRLMPIYNYLKEIDPVVQNTLFAKYGDESEFCRKTASPALGLMLNSGIQIMWLKQYRNDVFKKVKSILHFPQYLSYLITNQIVSESTSIGCHTFLWDFDNNQYHKWLQEEEIFLPEPKPNSFGIKIRFSGKEIFAGIGIHDSSASLVPYLKAGNNKFILISTGTWCINMNPFNHEPLSEYQLKKDCLMYISVDQNPVKSSRLFMGKIHDVNLERINSHFNVSHESYKNLKTDKLLIKKFLSKGEDDRIFFKNGIPDSYVDESVELSDFDDFSESYHRLMFDLTLLNKDSIDLISTTNDGIKHLYITGGFARNEIFLSLLANFYPEKEIFTSEIDNSSALGAALVVWQSLNIGKNPPIDNGLRKWNAF